MALGRGGWCRGVGRGKAGRAAGEEAGDVALGDAKLTRRAKERSAVHAVVVRFSRTRKRYERQGLLVQPAALESARAEIAAEKPAAKKASR